MTNPHSTSVTGAMPTGVADLLSKTDGDAVPSVDSEHRKRQVHYFLFTELTTSLFVRLVLNMILGDQG
jgi:hypothetical protein